MILTGITSAVVAEIALLNFATGQTTAGEDMPAPSTGLHGSIDMVVAVMPEHEGSKDHKTRVIPKINLFYGDSKVTKQEMSGSVQKLTDQLAGQSQNM